ncbi:hypothetical protein G6L41_026500 (plasmid) [Agrobacterium tumefaciens]|uniref:Transmembrane protein n=1 Tax=Agrobacterium burrii TaxID=2815339 RepID=A0ABS3EQ17_9HYPH|nr:MULTISPECIES: hypothetical protein [Rhizobium/Agrobacterium group]MBO0134108.1 hypothetical protein [Agrobacterium burrii]WCJ66192.1 hypothetical protein G6M15_24845 [Agrobacterium tumefaciens]WCK17253.1 hypothetical protein G6L41_026500 [Agrobacterium tumefaciens]
MYERDRSTRQSGPPWQPTKAGRLVAWFDILIGLALRSLLAWIGYVSADGILNWIAGNAGAVIENGKTIAGRGVGKDAIILIWAIAALVLVAIFLTLAKAGRFFGRLAPLILQTVFVRSARQYS